MNKSIMETKILILDEDGKNGNIFQHCYYGNEKIKRENIIVVETLSIFWEKARSFDVRFVDFGELGYDGCQRFHATGVGSIIEYLKENPSIDVWFVLTMWWEYYESFTELWELPNAYHIQLDEHRDNIDAIITGNYNDKRIIK
jgi:hypothetical protein